MVLYKPTPNIFAIYKPKGPTSHDIVDKIRKITGQKKVGHAGTLDPLASGVLVIGVGRKATKKLVHVVKKEKEYLAKVKLGETSTTDDKEGSKQKQIVPYPPSLTTLKSTLATFIGTTKQIPPIYSAVKLKGKPAYKMARQEGKVHLKPRLVTIKQIKFISYIWPYVKLRITTGPGVYIRALARDFGKKLKTGAYLNNLERTRVGEFTKSKALTLKQFATDWQ